MRINIESGKVIFWKDQNGNLYCGRIEKIDIEKQLCYIENGTAITPKQIQDEPLNH